MKLRIAGLIVLFYLLSAFYAVFLILRNQTANREYVANSSSKGNKYLSNGGGAGHHNHNDDDDDDDKLSRVANIFFYGDIDINDTPPTVIKEKPADRRLFESVLEKRYWRQWAPINFTHQRADVNASHALKPRISNQAKYTVDIWSNNGLGEYLWEHLLQGELRLRPDKLYRYGEKTINTVKYRYKGGQSLNVAFLPDATYNVVLVLNARDNVTMLTARSWLDGLAEFDTLQNVGVVLIGDEMCQNEWLLSYLHHKNVSSPKFVFLVYDSSLVDKKNIFQFPLGVATYRGFPLPAFPDIVVTGSRKYVCNFIGTVYPNSSRELLTQIVTNMNKQRGSPTLCYLGTRFTWQPQETADSLHSYINILRLSDLTLCPIGMNSESYRIYEAMSVGSVPVVEDKVANDSCASTPFRLLKQYRAPVIFVKRWEELQAVIRREEMMSLTAKQARREKLMSWYKVFRMRLAEQFTGTLEDRFFNHVGKR